MKLYHSISIMRKEDTHTWCMCKFATESDRWLFTWDSSTNDKCRLFALLCHVLVRPISGRSGRLLLGRPSSPLPMSSQSPMNHVAFLSSFMFFQLGCAFWRPQALCLCLLVWEPSYKRLWEKNTASHLQGLTMSLQTIPTPPDLLSYAVWWKATCLTSTSKNWWLKPSPLQKNMHAWCNSLMCNIMTTSCNVQSAGHCMDLSRWD